MRVVGCMLRPWNARCGALERGAEALDSTFRQRRVELARNLVPSVILSEATHRPSVPAGDLRCRALRLRPHAFAGSRSSTARNAARVAPWWSNGSQRWDAAGFGFALVYEAVRAQGSTEVSLPHGPDFFQFGSPERMLAALEETGFTDVEACSFDQNWHVANADRYIESILTGTVRARAVLAAQTGAAADGVRSYIADYLTRFRAPTAN